jgi:hypothetical protein
MKFALDPQSNPSQSLPAPRFQYQDKVYKQVQSDGTVSSLDSTSIFDVSNPNNSTPPDPTDPNPFSVLKVIRYGFKEWKGYLLSMDRRFYEVISPRFVATFTEFQVEAFSQYFWGRNKVAAQYILTPGMYVGENLYISIPFSEVTDFLLDEENEAESSSGFNFSIVPYSIVPAEGAIPINGNFPSTLFRNYTVSLDSESQLEVEIIKPVEFTKFLKDAAAEENGVQGVRIIDIVPLVDG